MGGTYQSYRYKDESIVGPNRGSLTDEELRLFKESQTDEYKRNLSDLVLSIVKEKGLELVWW